MVDVQHGALRALEQDPGTPPAQLGQPLPDRLGVGQEPRRQRVQPSDELGGVDRRLAEAGAQGVVVQQQLVDPAREQVGIGEVAHPDGAARDLVLVGGADAAPGRADPAEAAVARGARLLARTIELAVQRQDQGRVLGDAQAVGADRDALRAQRLDLVEQRPRDRSPRRCR